MREPGQKTSRRAVVAGLAVAAGVGPLARPSRAAGRGTLLLTHPAFLQHNAGPFHVERAERMTAIDAALSTDAFAALVRETAPMRDDVEQAILRAHQPAHLERIRSMAAVGIPLIQIDPDTAMSPGSLEAALLGVGAGLRSVDAVMTKDSGIANAFCQVRPPGHHAEQNRAMGFCLFSNIAIAGLYARARYGAQRIAVVDFDVHHGNGTQRIFWNDRDLFYASTHEMPLFPGSGPATETGAHGNVCNAPLKAGDGGDRFREAMRERVLPKLDAFRPDIVLISAGFDAHAGDPIAHLKLQADDFAWITLQLADIAARHCQGRVVSMLEGGYNLDGLARSTAAHVGALMQAAS